MNGSVINGWMEVWLGVDVVRWLDGDRVIERVGVDIFTNKSVVGRLNEWIESNGG